MKVTKLTKEQIEAKKIQLALTEDSVELLEVQLKQVQKRVKDGFFEKQAEVIKNDSLEKVANELKRYRLNLKAIKLQIKTGQIEER